MNDEYTEYDYALADKYAIELKKCCIYHDEIHFMGDLAVGLLESAKMTNIFSLIEKCFIEKL